MSRAERLLALLEELRRHRRPVRGEALAKALDVSTRTLYRDIASLRAQGASIDGEAGVGFRLRPGFLLPPLMFPEEELQALVLGSRWVAARGDAGLAEAARRALSRLAAVLPPEVADRLELEHLVVGPAKRATRDRADLALVRAAIRGERKLRITYEDSGGERSTRTIWPFLIGYFDDARLVSAWCELRQGFRHFRADRVHEVHDTGERYPTPRGELERRWRVEEGR
jgi:predicted DNA-binding transcriptional regulator YafY